MFATQPIKAILLAAACSLLASRALAKQAIKVDVVVEIAVPGIAATWNEASAAAIPPELEARLSARLNKDFRPWFFQPGRAGSPVLMMFRVVETIRGEISVRLEMTVPTRLDPIESVWKLPGDVDRDGYPSTAQEISEAFVTNLLTRQRQVVYESLRREVPIALSPQWDASNRQLLLPLLWENYHYLRNSEFVLACEWPTKGDAKLEAMAPGVQGSYTPAPPGPAFPAIVVVPKVRIFLAQRDPVVPAILTEIRKLVPKLVYLHQFHEPQQSWDVFGR